MSFNLQDYVAAIPDFPKPGILFRDVSPILASPVALAQAIFHISERWDGEIDCVVGLDARGFIFGVLVAQSLNVPFVMARKKGKLPGVTVSVSYELEYGTAELEIKRDAITSGMKALIVDDLLATGGTAAAAAELIKKSGGIVAGASFIIELKDLNGREQLGNTPIQSLITYGE